ATSSVVAVGARSVWSIMPATAERSSEVVIAARLAHRGPSRPRLTPSEDPLHTTVVDHPLAAQALGRLRDETTDRAAFRQAMDDLAGLLVVEATRSLPTVEVDIRTPLQPTTVLRVDPAPLTVPVLRAGLGLLPGVLRLLPD